MDQSKIDTSGLWKKIPGQIETVAPRRKSLRDSKITLNGRVNEGERKLGTRRASWWTRGEGVERRVKKKKRERGRCGERERRKKGEKKDVGFDVETGRILESNQNEVRSHEPYINQPRLLSSLPYLARAGPLYLHPYWSPRLSVLILPHRARY